MRRAGSGALRIGRYLLLDAFASGGMATVHFGGQLGPRGLGRLVAIKRLHPHLSDDPSFAAMFLDEARLAMRVSHPSVVRVLDVFAAQAELFLVMEFVSGLPLSRWVPSGAPAGMPRAVTSAVIGDVLLGLHGAHGALSEGGEPLDLVHRDVSPQNVLLGTDGLARIIDFGVAKARGRAATTRDACVKGTLGYMAPEQLAGGDVSARSDVYSASAILWECLTGRRLVDGDDLAAAEQVLLGDFDPPSRFAREVSPSLDDVVMRGLAVDPGQRWSSALDMTVALERAQARAAAPEVAAWIRRTAGGGLERRLEKARAAEAAIAEETRARTRFPGRMALSGGALLVTLAVIRAEASDAPRRIAGANTSDPGVSTPEPTAATAGSAEPPLVRTPAPIEPHSQPLAARTTPWPAPGAALQQNGAGPAAPSDACQVPYFVNEHGLKRYNRECLRR